MSDAPPEPSIWRWPKTAILATALSIVFSLALSIVFQSLSDEKLRQDLELAQRKIESALSEFSPSGLLTTYMKLTGYQHPDEQPCDERELKNAARRSIDPAPPDPLSNRQLSKSCLLSPSQDNSGWVTRHMRNLAGPLAVILTPFTGLVDLICELLWQPNWVSRCVGLAQLLIGFSITMRLLNAGMIPANLIWPPFAVVLFACLPAWALYGIGKLAAMALTKWTEFAVLFSYLGGIAGFAATFFTQKLETSIERTGERHIKRAVRRLMKEGDDGH